jgi:undecaprenyl-diphosphatase
MPTRRALPVLALSVSALVFAVLFLVVRLRWAPVESIDRGVADDLNSAVAGHAAVVSVLHRVTWFGSNGVLWTVTGASIVVLCIRRRFQLAGYLAVVGGGVLVLDPVLKSLIGRARPVVPHSVAHGIGNSFPSGHALGSIVCYGAVLLVLLPGVPPRFRSLMRIIVAALIIAIGCSRILLGVHYVSDVVGAWMLGIAWLGLSAYAVELSRHHSGRATSEPLSEGLEPEAGPDLELAAPEPRTQARHPARDGAALLVLWVLILGAVTGTGALIVRARSHNILGDESFPRWFAAHRTAGLTRWSQIVSFLGATAAIMAVSIAACVITIALLRRWRPVVFIATVMVGELAMFLAANRVVSRPRPDVPQLDTDLPTSSYPSGHVAATLCIYAAIAVIAIGHLRRGWRWLFLVPAIAMPTLVAISRLYRGEHHPTDVAGSLLLALLWLPATYLLIKPTIDRGEPRVPSETPQSTLEAVQ